MTARRRLPRAVEKEILISCRRRCCLCVYLDHRDAVCQGQIAHLNRNRADDRAENLAYLCLRHHDEYDSQPSQSRRLLPEEVAEYRDKLSARLAVIEPVNLRATEEPENTDESPYASVMSRFADDLWYMRRSWRFPLWLVGNQPDLFAYRAGSGSDGVCLIERIDIPDGRIVIAAIDVAGNPGTSISNCVEELCLQVCDRFEIPADRLVWLEHYDYYEPREWQMVVFDHRPPTTLFQKPRWISMTTTLWQSLQLRPKRRLVQSDGVFQSKLEKLFDWPTEALL